MNIIQLKYFSAVGEKLNISQTAKELFISQPSLSNSISRLEDELGFKLFIRRKNRLCLTEAGKCYLDYVNSALAQLSNGEKQALQIANQKNNRIRVSSSLGIIRKLSSDYIAANPSIQIDISLDDTEDLVRKVLSGEADFGLNFGPISNSQLISRVLMEAKYFVSVSKTHRFASRRTLLMEDLQGELLFCSNLGHTYEALQNMFAKTKGTYRLLKLDEQEVLFEAAAKELGDVVCVPMMFDVMPIESDSNINQLLFIPIIDCPDCGKVVVVTKKDGYIRSDAAQFLEYLSAKFFHIKENIQRDIEVRCAFEPR